MTDTVTAPLVSEPRLSWSCDVCRLPIADGDGWVTIDMRAVMAAEQAYRQWHIDHPGPAYNGAALLDIPGRIEWHVFHRECDPDPDGASYWFDKDTAPTYFLTAIRKCSSRYRTVPELRRACRLVAAPLREELDQAHRLGRVDPQSGDAPTVRRSAAVTPMAAVALAVPDDREAETTVVACAVASRKGARLARKRITPGDIWDPKLRRIYDVALALGEDEDLNGVSEDSLAARLHHIADTADVPLTDIQAIVSDRPVMWDSSGSYARRVADAARRRQVMTVCAQVYNQLGAGARLDDLADHLQQLEQAAAC